MDNSTTPSRAWLGVAVLALPALLASLELTVTHLALPTIGADLDASSTEQLWIVDIYAFMLAGAMLAMGSVGDRIGPRRLLLIGASVFGVASLLAAYAPNVESLIAIRAAMGIAGSTLMPSILALTTALFPDRRRRRLAVGAVIATVSAGTAVGPLVGGWLLEHFWWGSVFLIGLPAMGLLVLLGPRLLPEQETSSRRRIDVRGAALTVAAILPLVYALKRFGSGQADLLGAGLALCGVAFGIAFVRTQGRLDAPTVDFALFRNPAFRVMLLTLAFGIFILWGLNLAAAQYLQLVQDLTPFRAGLWTAPAALGTIAGSTLAPHLARRVGTGPTVGTGLLVAAGGFLLLAFVSPKQDSPILLVVGTVVVSAGLGPMLALATEHVISTAPAERASAASAMASMAPQLGGALGIAALGSIVTAGYRHRMADAVDVGTPSGPARLARDNLAGALDAGGHLSPPARAQLVETAREAFGFGFRVAAAISCLIAVALALAVLCTLRGIAESNSPGDDVQARSS